MSKYVFTLHAKMRMDLRGVTEEMVRETIERPERLMTGYRNRRLAFRSYPQGDLKVVFAFDDDQAVIISVMWE